MFLEAISLTQAGKADLADFVAPRAMPNQRPDRVTIATQPTTAQARDGFLSKA